MRHDGCGERWRQWCGAFGVAGIAVAAVIVHVSPPGPAAPPAVPAGPGAGTPEMLVSSQAVDVLPSAAASQALARTNRGRATPRAHAGRFTATPGPSADEIAATAAVVSSRAADTATLSDPDAETALAESRQKPQVLAARVPVAPHQVLLAPSVPDSAVVNVDDESSGPWGTMTRALTRAGAETGRGFRKVGAAFGRVF